MKSAKLLNKTIKIVLPLILGGGILYWMYRDFDFKSLSSILYSEMNWVWMLLSLPFGILAQAFRGWRWKIVLAHMGNHTRSAVCVNAIFLSYAVSLFIPRIGEIARCGVLNKYDKVSFPKLLGTVVSERIVDTIIVFFFSALAIVSQVSVFSTFFSRTGTRMSDLIHKFSTTGWLVTLLCGIAVLILAYCLRRKLFFYQQLKTTIISIWQGISSVKSVKSIPSFYVYSIAIWICYFIHFYLTFFCFDFTKDLGITCALVCFVVGSIAVIVPTPNGAGSWHFAVKTMLILYGVADTKALYFVLIVHTIQTLLVILLGIYAWLALTFTKIKNEKSFQYIHFNTNPYKQ